MSSNDRGDDLLDQRVELPEVGELTGARSTGVDATPEDALQSAQILEAEGLLDEAKKVLRGILVLDRDHLEARRRLQAIHDEELKQIFRGDGRGYRTPDQRAPSVLDPVLIDLEKLSQKLDDDLGLKMYDLPLPTEDKVEIQQLGQRFAEDTSLEHQERLDLAVAFMEMELYPVVEQILVEQLTVTREVRGEGDEEKEFYLSFVFLTAYAQLLSGESHRAVVTLEPLVQDGTLSSEQLVEVLYLMARAYEQQGKDEIALRWYERVLKSEGRHRDTNDRSARLRLRVKDRRKGGASAF